MSKEEDGSLAVARSVSSAPAEPASRDVSRYATISECGRYRYLLSRIWRESSGSPARIDWNPETSLVFVMLNPSTADAYQDDPTIRRCVGFARRDGFDGMHVINLFAGRATKPADLFRMDDPEGPENRRVWNAVASSRHTIVCGWGAAPSAQRQAEAFVETMGERPLYCLGLTKDGHPRHPLYLRNDASLQPFNEAARSDSEDTQQAQPATPSHGDHQ